MSDALVIDTPDGIEHFRVCAIIAALKIQSNGIRMGAGRNPILAAQQYGFQGKQTKGALKYMLQYYKEVYGKEYGA